MITKYDKFERKSIYIQKKKNYYYSKAVNVCKGNLIAI